MARYYREHRRHPRVAVEWPAEVRLQGGTWSGSFTATNLSSGGIGLHGPEPVVFDLPEGSHPEPRFDLRLTLPQGRVLDQIEVVQVWETRQQGQLTSGWRLVGLPAAVWQALQQEVGEGVPLVPETPVAPYDAWGEDEVELWDYVRTLVRRRWVAIGSAVAGAIIAAVMASQEPVLYLSQAQVLPVGDVDVLTRTQGMPGSTTPFLAVLRSVPLSRRIAARSYLLTSDSAQVHQTLVEYCRSKQKDQQQPVGLSQAAWERQQEAQALGWLGAMTAFEQRKDDRILVIKVKAEEPELAAQIANAYVEELKDQILRSGAEVTDQNLDMARARMDSLELELKQAERNLEAFRLHNQQLLGGSGSVELTYPEVATLHGQYQRELALKQNLYNTVANQYELLRLSRTKTAAGIEIISKAEPPLSSEPRPVQKYAVLGGAVGLFLGIFLAFLLEYLANKQASGQMAPLRQAWEEDWGRLRRLLRPGS